MDAAVESLSATPSEIGAARVATPPPTNARRRPRRTPLRARLAARGALALADVPPLSAWRPREGLASRARALAPKLSRGAGAARARWLEEAAALHRGEGLATVAALAAAWAPGPASTFAGDPERDARALPATLPATTRTIAREGAGDGVGGAGDGVFVAAVASSLVESAARGDAEAAEAAREMRGRVPAETWRRRAWTLETATWG